jgi:hypothetical protein
MLCQPLSPIVSISYIQRLGYVHGLFGTPISQLAIRRANWLITQHFNARNPLKPSYLNQNRHLIWIK